MILIKFIKWKLIDIFRFTKDRIQKKPIKINLYGIYGFFGLPGHGKTMALSERLTEYRNKYGDKIYIATNYNFNQQDFSFDSWEQLTKTYDKPLVVAWDEVQNEFNSRNFKTFPTELLTILTQNRKGNGIQILYTAQRFDRVDKVFRELTHQACECKTHFGRYTRLKFYHWEDYVQLNSTPIVELKMKIRATRKHSFVQTDKLRNSYDSYKMLESAKSKKYMSREEINLLTDR